MKKNIKIFVSYAKKNKVAKADFLERFQEYAGADNKFKFEFWIDEQLAVDKDWDESIHKALDDCDFGILLLSPAFLQSSYIAQNELPRLVNKPLVFPVALAPIDFKRHDLKGLQAMQIFRLDSPKFNTPRAFTELKPKRRDEFVMRLYEAMHDQLVIHLDSSKSSSSPTSQKD